jgi:hypothetical protein
MSLKAMFIICSSFIFGVARLCKPCIRSYSAHPTGPWVSDRYYVSVVLRYLFIYGCPYMPRRVVDRVDDSCVEYFAVHPPYILMLVEPDLEGEDSISNLGDSCVEYFAVHPPYILMLVEPDLEGEDYISNFSKWMFLMWPNLAMITRYN